MIPVTQESFAHMPDPRTPFADNVLELSVAAVLVTVPLFVVPYSALPFEEAKVALLRTTALFALPFFVMALIRKVRYPGNTAGFKTVPFQLLFVLVLLFAYVHLVSALFSVSPEESIFGALLRRQGTFTTFCYLFFFFVAATSLRTHRQIDRVLLSVLLAGFVVSFWVILQYLGLDPNLTGGFREPTWSTFGNRLFMPAFLMMCIPVNIYYLNRAFNTCCRSREYAASFHTGVRHWVFFLSTLLFLALNILSIVVAQKRGPILGLMIGLFFFLILYVLGRGYRKTAAYLLGGGGLLASLVMFVGTAGHRVGILANIPLANALAESFHSGSGLVRFYIWKSVFDLLASHPARAVIGYGAETLPFVLPVHSYAILKQIESPTAVADRAHNEILDMMVMQGFFGTVAFLMIFGIIGYIALFQMGLIPSRRHRFAWVASLSAGCVLGCLSVWFLGREMAWAGMGIGVGMVGGFFLYLGWYIMTTSKRDHIQWSTQKLLLSLLLSALTAHFIEIQFSFGITATRLYFWVFAGMIVAVGFFVPGRKNAGVVSEQENRFTLPPPVFPGILSGFVIITISFDYLCFSRYHDDFLYSVIGCLICTIFFCWFFFKPGRPDEAGQPCPWRQRGVAYFMVVLVVGIMYYFGYFVLQGVVAQALHPLFKNSVATVLEKNVRLMFYYGWMLVVLLVGARLILGGKPAHAGSRGKPQTAWFYLLMILLMLAPAIRFNFNYSMADIYTKAGDERARIGDWRMAGKCYNNAIALEPGQAWRHQKLGHLFFTRARKAPEPRKSSLYREAILQVEKATQLAPLDITLKNNLARMGSAWAMDGDGEKARFHRLKLTEAFYDRALGADPNNPLLWKEAGQISAALGSLDEAIKQFNRALNLQPDDFESHRNLALLHKAIKQYPQALGHSHAALDLAEGEDRAEIESLITELKRTMQQARF